MRVKLPLIAFGFFIISLTNSLGQTPRIDAIRIDQSGQISIIFQSVSNRYYLLTRSERLNGYSSSEAMLLGRDGEAVFVTHLSAPSGFFRIQSFSNDLSGDTDGDGIDDVFELSHATIMNPLKTRNANIDSDGDGVSDYEEYLHDWGPENTSSPTPVELSRVSGGQKLLSVVSDIDTLQAGIPGLLRVLPEVSVNDHGVVAFIAELSNGSGGTNRQIFTRRRGGDGSWAVSPVLSIAQTTDTVNIGVGLQINNANTILVRRVVQDNSPLGIITYSYVEIWNGNATGQYQTVAAADPLNVSEFRRIDSNMAYNNRGSLAFFAEGKLQIGKNLVDGRWLMGKSSSGYVPTPLNPTTPYVPLSLSDADTLVLRIGDSAGQIRLYGMPNIGDRLISRIASGANGFSNLGLRPGISADGRIVAFYGNYDGQTNSNIGTTGPGVFALVYPSAISSSNVAQAKLVRIAGLAGNGQWDPGEVWSDSNTNGLLEMGEDKGIITGFSPDQRIGISSDGFISFAAQARNPSSSLRAEGMLTDVAAIVATKLRSYYVPAPGPMMFAMSTINTLPSGLPIATFMLHDPIASSGAPYCAFSASDSSGGQSTPVICNLSPFDISADNDDDGNINEADDAIEEIRPLVIPLRLNKPDDQSVRKVILRAAPVLGATFRLSIIGSGKVSVINENGGVLLPLDSTESQDLSSFLTGSDLVVNVVGHQKGEVELVFKMETTSTVHEDSLSIRVVNADVVFRNGNQELARMITYDFTHGGIDTGDDHIYDVAGPGIQTMQNVDTFFSKAATTAKKRMVFSLTHFMGGRIVERLHDNLKSAHYQNPTGQQPWNLFTTSDSYTSGNCLEWLNQQWMKAADDVSSEISDKNQLDRFKRAYFEVGAPKLRSLVAPVLLLTGAYEDPLAYAAYLRSLELYVDLEIARNDRDAKALWNNSFEGQEHFYYPGWHDTPLADVPIWVKLLGPPLVHGHLRTITPQSYAESSFFREVPY